MAVSLEWKFNRALLMRGRGYKEGASWVNMEKNNNAYETLKAVTFLQSVLLHLVHNFTAISASIRCSSSL